MNVAEELSVIRARVHKRLSHSVPEVPEMSLPELDALRQARSSAEGWAAAMGAINPRQPGLLNSLAQSAKRLLGRGLRWFAFPQTQFNSGAVAAMIRTEETFADINRNLLVLAETLSARITALEEKMQQAIAESAAESAGGTQMVLDAFRQRIEQLEQLVSTMPHLDARISEMGASVNARFHQDSQSVAASLQQMSASTSSSLEQVHADVAKTEERFFAEIRKFREEIGEEVRLARQRARQAGDSVPSPATAVGAAAAGGGAAAPGAVAAAAAFDYSHFEQRFRGKEADIRQRQSFYLPILRDSAPVLDIACGRGEMLELLREQGISASGVDLDPDMVARCHSKSLPVQHADALVHLESLPENSLGAVFSAQFVEHLPAPVYIRLIELAYSRLRPEGRLILETQNPECLAIFSQSFYLDPTHVRPVPAEQLRFLMEESGFRNIEVHYLSPLAGAGLPQLPGTDEATRQFNEKFFGFMDYGIVGVKPGVRPGVGPDLKPGVKPGVKPGPRPA